MLSRVAERMYWLGRYIERAENIARLVNVNASLQLDLPRGVKLPWYVLTDIMDLTEEFQERYRNTDERSIIRFLLADKNNPSSLVSTVRFAARMHAPRERYYQPKYSSKSRSCNTSRKNKSTKHSAALGGMNISTV